MEEYLHQITLWLATLAEIFAVIIIGIASVRAFMNYVLVLIKRRHESHHNSTRLQLGRSLALGLEFLLGADILKTVVSPTWHDLGILAAIAFLRTALNYFLDKELANHEKMKERDQGTPQCHTANPQALDKK